MACLRFGHASLILAAAACLRLPVRAQSTSLPDAPTQHTEPQQTGPPPPQTDDEKTSRHAQAQRELEAEERQRILVVVPNFTTVISGRAVPLSAGQKTQLAVHATLDPFNIVGAFFLGGLSELNGSDRAYGWGPAGYAKRVSSNYLDTVDGTMLAGAVFPILLHQDPRFFRQGTGRIGSRIRHALAAPFVCRGDNGRRQPNYSNIFGNFGAGAISNAYHPAADRGVGLTLSGGAIVLIEGSLGNIGLEFSPDVASWWHHRHDPASRALQSQP